MFPRFTPLILLAFMVSPSMAQDVIDGNLTVTPYATGLSSPTQIRFIGDNDLFVTEKATGVVQRVINGGAPTEVLDLNVNSADERGLLGLTLDPGFAGNGLVYVYYSVPSVTNDTTDPGEWLENRLSSFVWNGTALTSETPLATFGSAADGQTEGPNHDGGPITFGPDGALYGINGDLNRDMAEQNNQSAAGSSAFVGGVYRLNANGSVPADNPFVSQANTDFHRWYAYGVRNSYGIAFDPVTGNLWDTENGPESYDEINLVASGFNSGWNEIMGPDSRDTQGVGDLVQFAGSAYSDPEFSFFAPVAVTGLAFLAPSNLDASYDDALLVGDAINGNLYLFRLNAARDGFVLPAGLTDLVADSVGERDLVEFGEGFGAITDIQIGPDGAVYVTGHANGIIYRIIPEPSSLLCLALGGAMLVGLRRGRYR
jgi:aldose sugar dehydrogenase